MLRDAFLKGLRDQLRPLASWAVGVVFAIFIIFILVRPEGLVRRQFSRAI